MFNDLKNVAGSALGSSGGILQMIMNMTDLDDKAMEMLEEQFGREKIEEVKSAIADGKIDANDLENVAEKFGMPKMVLELLLKYFQK
jgi:NAD/NADP transhydrogenase beta subunit